MRMYAVVTRDVRSVELRSLPSGERCLLEAGVDKFLLPRYHRIFSIIFAAISGSKVRSIQST